MEPNQCGGAAVRCVIRGHRGRKKNKRKREDFYCFTIAISFRFFFGLGSREKHGRKNAESGPRCYLNAAAATLRPKQELTTQFLDCTAIFRPLLARS